MKKKLKTRRIRVCYHVTLREDEFNALVDLGREWKLDFGKAKPLVIAKRALQNSGDSGCLAQIPTVKRIQNDFVIL